MRILVLGIGKQGRAALHDLSANPAVSDIIAADVNLTELSTHVKRLNTSKIEPVALDVADQERLTALVRRADAVINLLPSMLQLPIARVAVANGVHVIDTSYASPELRRLGEEAAARGVAILPEFGFDPGIDLVMAGDAVRELDEVHEYHSYGTGIPDPVAARTNALHYKISWSLPGVLKAYRRDARIIREGAEVVIPGREIFAPENVHEVELAGYGSLEAYPNGDPVGFLNQLGIRETVRNAGRYSARWPGHCAFWYAASQLGLLDDEPISAGGVRVAPRHVLECLMEASPYAYAEGERDMAILRVDMRGIKDGHRRRLVYDLCDLLDPATGLMAMNRTVGYTASIGTQMILRGEITKRGLLSPLKDVPIDLFFRELAARGITVQRRSEDW